MKVLTHAGVLVTIPFTMGNIGRDEFERIDANGTTEVGVVSEMSEAEVRRLIAGATQPEQALLNRREMLKDAQFIALALFDVPLGTEIRIESTQSRIKLVIPPEAMPRQESVVGGPDRG